MNTPTTQELDQIRRTRIVREMRALAEKLRSEGKIEFNKDHKKLQ